MTPRARDSVTVPIITACIVLTLGLGTVGVHRLLFDRPARPTTAPVRLYACVTDDGTVSKVRAHHIGCAPDEQTVTWKVSAP